MNSFMTMHKIPECDSFCYLKRQPNAHVFDGMIVPGFQNLHLFRKASKFESGHGATAENLQNRIWNKARLPLHVSTKSQQGKQVLFHTGASSFRARSASHVPPTVGSPQPIE